MRDLTAKWPAEPDWATATLAQGDVVVEAVPRLRQLFVSGDLSAWRRMSGLDGERPDAGEAANGGRYAVRIGRTKLLVVSDQEIDVAPGWHSEGVAVTAMEGALQVFDIRGPGVPRLLTRATPSDPRCRSASAAIPFAGVEAVLYRYEQPNRIRLHVDRGLAGYVWEWLEHSLTLDRSKRI